jgi:hypothetical protein
MGKAKKIKNLEGIKMTEMTNRKDRHLLSGEWH